MGKNIQNTLLKIARELNENEISWALGGSLLIKLSNINTTVADIDILVDEKDFQKLDELIKKYHFTYISKNKKYATSHFYTITIDNVDIDIMVGFKIRTTNGIYSFPFKITKEIVIDGEKIYLSSLKEWGKAYQLMDRTDKVKMLIKAGITHD